MPTITTEDIRKHYSKLSDPVRRAIRLDEPGAMTAAEIEIRRLRERGEVDNSDLLAELRGVERDAPVVGAEDADLLDELRGGR